MSPLLPLLVAAAVFVAAALIVAGGVAVVTGRTASSAPPPGGPSPTTARIVAGLGTLARPGEADERERLRDGLLQAGLGGARAVELYLASRAALALCLPALAWVALRPSRPLVTLLLLLAAATLGYYLPFFVVAWLRDRRQHALRLAFPNALDMLVSCLEAGHGVDTALRHVGEEMSTASPDLARQIALVNTELAAGVPRVDALRHMHRRTGLEEVGSLVNELAQAERYGSQVAQALRIHARLTRTQRILDAERRAAEATPKLTVVMVLFVLPPLFIVLLGPTVVTLLERFGPSGVS